MKKNSLLKVSVLVPLLLAVMQYSSMTTLSAVSKPYCGVYECEYMMFGEEDLLDDFEYVRFELLPSNVYKIEFRDKNKVKGVYRGKYTIDEKEGVIRIDETVFGNRVTKSFPIEKGEIELTVQYGDRLLAVKFKMV